MTRFARCFAPRWRRRTAMGSLARASSPSPALAIRQNSSPRCAVSMTDATGARPATETPATPASWAHRVEAWGAAFFFAAFGLLPLDAASGSGGALARWIGPRLGISQRARRNLRAALPELSPPQIERIVRGMWDNLGRIAAEYPQLRRIRVFEAAGRVETRGIEHLDQALA